MSAVIALVGPVLTPGAPQITPAIVNLAVNAALTADAATAAAAVTAEAARATAAEAALAANIAANATAVTAEQTARIAAVAAEVAARNAAIAVETARATAAEAVNATAIAGEATARIAADALSAPLASPSLSNSLTVTGAAPVVYLAGSASNLLHMTSAGIGPPTFNTRSIGTKFSLYDSVGAAFVDYAVGVASGTLWFSVPQVNDVFAFYAGITQVASISGAGAIAAASITTTGTSTIAGYLRSDPTTLAAAILAMMASLPTAPVGTGATLWNNGGVPTWS